MRDHESPEGQPFQVGPDTWKEMGRLIRQLIRLDQIRVRSGEVSRLHLRAGLNLPRSLGGRQPRPRPAGPVPNPERRR